MQAKTLPSQKQEEGRKDSASGEALGVRERRTFSPHKESSLKNCLILVYTLYEVLSSPYSLPSKSGLSRSPMSILMSVEASILSTSFSILPSSFVPAL